MPKILNDERDPVKLELGKRLRKMKQEEPEKLAAFLQSLSEGEADEILYDQEIWARENQWVDLSDGFPITLLLAGRGYGKGWTGASTIKRAVDRHRIKDILIIAPTARDFRANIAPSVIGMYSPNDKNRPYWSPAKASIIWPNSGAVAVCVPSSATEDSVRGLNMEYIFVDELGVFENDIVTQALLTLRREPSKMVIATTPRATPMIIDLYQKTKDPNNKYVKLIQGTTYENLDNLSEAFGKTVIDKYEGTFLGRQELSGELILTRDSALWSYTTVKNNIIDLGDVPPLVHVCIGVDPAVLQKNKAKGGRTPDDTGICVSGMDAEGLIYVIEGVSASFSVEGWVHKVAAYFNKYSAHCKTNIMMEINQHGEDMIHMAFDQSGHSDLKRWMISNYATQSKLERAMPYSLLAEQGKIKYVSSDYMDLLEMELTTYDGTGKSPNAMDSAVWSWRGLAPAKRSYTVVREFSI